MANGNGQVVVLDDAKPTAADKVDQLIRGGVVTILTFGFVVGFLWTKVVSTESFALVYGIAMTWWFSSRDKKQAADSTAAAVKAASSPAPPPVILPPPPGGTSTAPTSSTVTSPPASP